MSLNYFLPPHPLPEEHSSSFISRLSTSSISTGEFYYTFGCSKKPQKSLFIAESWGVGSRAETVQFIAQADSSIQILKSLK